MTVEQKIRTLLAEHGLWPDKNVDAVMKIYKETHPEIEDKVWQEPLTAYPPQMIVAIWMGVRHTVVRWIDENCPEAFYRPMFTDEEIPNG